MNRLIAYFLLLCLPCLCMAQSPRMGVRGRDGSLKLLQLDEARVSVRFLGGVAETVMDLTFRNDGDRDAEGEFVLPLPEGATVSSYALEVNGELRDAVAVEKERARIAYETVKRRMIDPGIVEREAGNLYRTKVYPVPARGTKRLRICYDEILHADDEGYVYALPLDFPDPPALFRCELSGAAPGDIRIVDAAGLEFADDGLGGINAEHAKTRVSGLLKLRVKELPEPRMMVSLDSEPEFFLSLRAPELVPRPRVSPASVMLVWDASASGAGMDREKEFALLDAWFAKLGKTRVSLRLLRDRLEVAGDFEVRRGRWSKLKKALQQIDYDGATDLSAMKVATGQADLVVYVGDGVSTLGSGAASVVPPLVYLHTGPAPPARLLAKAACSFDGSVIDLSVDRGVDALGKLTQRPLRVVAVVGDDVKSVLPEWDWNPATPIRVFGKLREARAGKLEVRFGYGHQVVATRAVIYQPGGVPTGWLRRLHAQRVLAELEEAARPDQDAITRHCKSHGLVSDFTSLIVLERIEDYAEHRIPPPEPGLQAQYQELVTKDERRRKLDLGGLAYAWPRRLWWHARRFPGYEALILPRVKQVGIWKSAVESQFGPGQRDPRAFATVAGWFDRASGLIKGRADLQTREDYQEWRGGIDALHAEGPKLVDTPLQAPSAGEPLAVSVRGFVVEPGVVTGEAGMSLRQAIAKAGGLHAMGGLNNVALYRNAGKTVYNTLSEEYQDIALFPADMLVVGRPYSYDEWDCDPFAEATPPADPGKEPAIREQADVWTAGEPGMDDYREAPIGETPIAAGAAVPPGAGSFPMTPATPSAIRQHVPPAVKSGPVQVQVPVRPREIAGVDPDVRVRAIERVEAMVPGWDAFVAAMDDGGDPETAYRKLRSGRIQPPEFYVEVARVLFSKGQTPLALRVLSNLVEHRPGDESAARAHAFWLAGFGRLVEAENPLSAIAAARPEDLRAHMDLLSVLAENGSEQAAEPCLWKPLSDMESHRGGELAAIALTEFNGMVPRGDGHPLARFGESYRKNLDADIRIVVLSSNDDSSLRFKVEEPGGFHCSRVRPTSPCGGRIAGSGGVREYTIRHAVPGVYQISCASEHPVTVRVVIHSDWGRPGHKSRVETLSLDGDMMRKVGKVEFEFRAAAP